MSARAVGGRSTAVVLWLMILLVFLPIGAAHVIARHTEPGTGSIAVPAQGPAQSQVLPGRG